jgi:stress-induced-phosphoprotein 1
MKEHAKCMKTCDDALVIDAEHHGGKHCAELEGQKQKAAMAMYGVGGGTLIKFKFGH